MVNQTPLSLDLNRMTPKAFNIQQPGVDGFYLHLRLNPHHCYIKKKKKRTINTFITTFSCPSLDASAGSVDTSAFT